MIDHGYGVTLGPLEESNLELMRAWRNDYAIWKTCRQNDLINAPSHKKWFERVCQDPTIKMYEIRHKGLEFPIGVCGLTSIDLYNRRAEFSVYIDPAHQGKGFAKMALKTLLAHAFKTLGLETVWGETFAGNSAISTFEKIGFKREGTRRNFYFREGRFLDAYLVSILASEWRAACSPVTSSQSA
jgi:RimJ/RimL family protein N-acetyltransferase